MIMLSVVRSGIVLVIMGTLLNVNVIVVPADAYCCILSMYPQASNLAKAIQSFEVIHSNIEKLYM